MSFERPGCDHAQWRGFFAGKFLKQDPQDGPREPQDGTRWPQDCPEELQIDPRRGHEEAPIVYFPYVFEGIQLPTE